MDVCDRKKKERLNLCVVKLNLVEIVKFETNKRQTVFHSLFFCCRSNWIQLTK